MSEATVEKKTVNTFHPRPTDTTGASHRSICLSEVFSGVDSLRVPGERRSF